jgi:hypothetical protein
MSSSRWVFRCSLRSAQLHVPCLHDVAPASAQDPKQNHNEGASVLLLLAHCVVRPRLFGESLEKSPLSEQSIAPHRADRYRLRQRRKLRQPDRSINRQNYSFCMARAIHFVESGGISRCRKDSGWGDTSDGRLRAVACTFTRSRQDGGGSRNSHTSETHPGLRAEFILGANVRGLFGSGYSGSRTTGTGP